MSSPSVLPQWPTPSAPPSWAAAPLPPAPPAWPQAPAPQAWPQAPAPQAWPSAYAPSSPNPWPSATGSRLDGSPAGPSVTANLKALGGTVMDSLRQLWGQLMQAFKA